MADALGGADGALVTEGFAGKPLYIDFRHDLITITNSRGERPRAGFVAIPLERNLTGLLTIRAQVAGVRVQAIIDTGGGESFPSPPIDLGSIQIRGARITYRDMHIFAHWHLTHEPALLIGMDVLGLLEVFIIDYRRHELQLRMRTG